MKVRDKNFDFSEIFVVKNENFFIQIPKTIKKNPNSQNSSKEIPIAHPGASYNPSLDDYQELLENCAATELIKEKEEEKLARKLALPAGVQKATEVYFCFQV